MYAGFSKGGEGGGGENNEDQKTFFSTQNQSVKTKKGLLSKLVRFLAQNFMKIKKKQVFTQILFVCVLKRSAHVAKGGGGMPKICILFYANYTILETQTGGHGTMPPLKTPLDTNIFAADKLSFNGQY